MADNTAELGIKPPSEADISKADQIQKKVVSGEISGLKGVIKDWKLQIAGSIGGLLSLVSTTPQIHADNLEDEQVEIQRDRMLPEQYLQKAQVIEFKDTEGNLTRVSIGISVPADTPIQSPSEGLLSVYQQENHQLVSIHNPEQKLTWSIFPVQYWGDIPTQRPEIAKNASLGKTSDLPLIKLPDGNEVNLLISLIDLDNNHQGFDHTTEVLKQYFPEAFENPSITQTIESGILPSSHTL